MSKNVCLVWCGALSYVFFFFCMLIVMACYRIFERNHYSLEIDVNMEKEGIQVLVSDFGSVKYVCEGSCFCEKERRTSVSVFKRNLVYVVAGASSLLAMRKAKEYFEEKCEKRFAVECSSSVVSEVAVCGVVQTDDFDDGMDEEVEVLFEDRQAIAKREFESTEFGKKRHACMGKCLKNAKLPMEYVEDSIAFNCNKMTYETVIPRLIDLEYRESSEYDLEVRELDIVKQIFEDKYLDPYCKEISEKEYEFEVEGEEPFIEYVHLCTGRRHHLVLGNPTIICMKDGDYMVDFDSLKKKLEEEKKEMTIN